MMDHHADIRSTASIFVQIASYRDSDLPATLANLIARARFPGRLHFGICLQLMPDDPLDWGPAAFPRHSNLAVLPVDARDSLGVCWARHKAQQLYSHEHFSLQIDSHMRAVDGWDVELVDCWLACQDPDAVLSVYPNGFELPDLLKTDTLSILAAHQFDPKGILRLRGLIRFQLPDRQPEAPIPGAFVSAGFLFGPGRLVRDVPYDPELYFYGEEISLAARIWTHGFNIFNPDRLLLFHLYKRSGHASSTHWADHRDWSDLNRRSLQRVHQLLGQAPVDTSISFGDDGLGSARSLQDFQDWCGVDFANAVIQPHALKGIFGQTASFST
jgi:hypothetical protein